MPATRSRAQPATWARSGLPTPRRKACAWRPTACSPNGAAWSTCCASSSNRLPPRYASAATWCPRTRVRKAAEPFGGTTAGRLRSACLGAFRLDFFRFGTTQLGADQALHHAQLAIAELQRGVDPDLGDPHQLVVADRVDRIRSEEHTSELQSLMRISYAVFCLKKKKQQTKTSIKNSEQNVS